MIIRPLQCNMGSWSAQGTLSSPSSIGSPPVLSNNIARQSMNVQPHSHPEEAAWLGHVEREQSRFHEKQDSEALLARKGAEKTRTSALPLRWATVAVTATTFLMSSSCMRILRGDIENYGNREFATDAALILGGVFALGITLVFGHWHISDWRAGKKDLVPRKFKVTFQYIRSLRIRSVQELEAPQQDTCGKKEKQQPHKQSTASHPRENAQERTKRAQAKARAEAQTRLRKRMRVDGVVNHFEVLGFDPSLQFDKRTLKQAMRKRLKLYHEDRVAHLGPKLKEVAKDETRKILTAYEILSDNEKRTIHLYELRNNESNPR